MIEIKSLLVYCGANEGYHPMYTEAAKGLGKILVREKIKLIYGGGSVGLMGILANEVLNGGGEVEGVIPDFLNSKEIGHKKLTKMHIVKSMHERKAVMEKLCDAAIALPGGFGTMDEIFEMLTWKQLGLHKKPIGILNQNGFYNHFVLQMNRMVEEGFLTAANRDLLFVGETIPSLLAMMMTTEQEVPTEKWIKPGQE
ncbi:MAG TPA: TIGR00730 family Rossman fold protein [Bacteroidia bacterium]|nr:TIGR00730 family Rossman fold protein [Bacteroidia bacterium]